MNKRFKQVREYFGLSQTQFAQRMGKSPGCISSIEAGKTLNVSDETIDSLCSAFAVDRNWLVSGVGEMFVPGKEKSKADKDGVGSRIRKVRKETSLTQEQFAKEIGYSASQVFSAEAGRLTPSNDFLLAVSTKFDVNYNWLLTGKGNQNGSVKPVDRALIKWLNAHKDVLEDLRNKAGLN